ncbi:MAG: hypothetical protein BHW59_00100 [Desulfovibrio piger]|nr:MAG: hypothetical protein BHW59_00100 [Desulfovibrio piger]
MLNFEVILVGRTTNISPLLKHIFCRKREHSAGRADLAGCFIGHDSVAGGMFDIFILGIKYSTTLSATSAVYTEVFINLGTQKTEFVLAHGNGMHRTNTLTRTAAGAQLTLQLYDRIINTSFLQFQCIRQPFLATTGFPVKNLSNSCIVNGREQLLRFTHNVVIIKADTVIKTYKIQQRGKTCETTRLITEANKILTKNQRETQPVIRISNDKGCVLKQLEPVFNVKVTFNRKRQAFTCLNFIVGIDDIDVLISKLLTDPLNSIDFVGIGIKNVRQNVLLILTAL